MTYLRPLPLLLVFTLLVNTNVSVADTRSFENIPAIDSFIKDMVKKHRFKAHELHSLFEEARLHQSILDAIARPAESKPWHEYRPIFVNSTRVNGGVRFWDKNDVTLEKAQQTYGVPPEIIVAIIGVETRYGRHTGRYPVLDALATLAFAYPPRSQFFRSELEQYLLMTREERLDPLEQRGSYAGAMGMPQFISSSFRRYAVDFDGDGERNLWSNTKDAIGSVGNYFKKHHWQPGQPIASRVEVRGKRYAALLNNGLKPRWSLKELKQHGVILPKGLPADIKGALIKLDTEDGPEFWVGWKNFYVISRYNHSALYSMAVYQLSERISEDLEWEDD